MNPLPWCVLGARTELGYVDEVIAPHETRVRIISSLRALHDKRAAMPAKKHGNIPL